jgi:predicted RNA-binding Zn-ribbon protein involved in translation (DUF1610 family)
MGILDLLGNIIKPKAHSNIESKCPKCGTPVNMGMERCPSCGVHIESMFRIECPKCKAANDLKAEKCTKCGYALIAPPSTGGKTQYRCPLCGYSADYYMLSCPACGVKFV